MRVLPSVFTLAAMLVSGCSDPQAPAESRSASFSAVMSSGEEVTFDGDGSFDTFRDSRSEGKHDLGISLGPAEEEAPRYSVRIYGAGVGRPGPGRYDLRKINQHDLSDHGFTAWFVEMGADTARQYEVVAGELLIESSEADFIKGEFVFSAELQWETWRLPAGGRNVEGGPEISVTGEFQVPRLPDRPVVLESR